MTAFSFTKLQPSPLHLSFNHHRSFSPSPFPSSLSFVKSPPSIITLKASTSNSSSSPLIPLQSPLINSLKSLSFITLTALASLFLTRFPRAYPALASPAPTVESINTKAPSVSSTSSEVVTVEQKESEIRDQLAQNPDDVNALRLLMELKIKTRKLVEAVEVIDKLIELEPDQDEWRMLRAHIYSYMGDVELSRKGFEEILEKDPLQVEGYHGLVMANSADPEGLKEVMKRIEAAVRKCKKEKKWSEVRDLKLLVAHVRVIEGKYEEALKVYKGLVKEDPGDFRPYLCQGIIYTLLRKDKDAEQQFEKYRRLVPKNHPYVQCFDDNMFTTKSFAQKVDREKPSKK